MRKYICPICNDNATPNKFGDLNIAICSNCGHGYLHGRKEENETFESYNYATWRVENMAYLRREAKKKVDDILNLTKVVPRTVLEYGCATGEVLAEFENIGTKCYGLDLSETSIKHGLEKYPNISFKVGKKPDDGQLFDVVIACHVLEHIENVSEFISGIKSHLIYGGYVYLTVPNFGSLSRIVLHGYWPDLMPEHLQYFTPRSLQYFLQRYGFEVILTQTKGRAWQWLGGIKRMIRRRDSMINVKRPPGAKAMSVLRTADKLLVPILTLERLLGVGSELTIIGKKLGN